MIRGMQPCTLQNVCFRGSVFSASIYSFSEIQLTRFKCARNCTYIIPSITMNEFNMVKKRKQLVLHIMRIPGMVSYQFIRLSFISTVRNDLCLKKLSTNPHS